MKGRFLQNPAVQLLLPTQHVPRSALAKGSGAMLVKGQLSAYPNTHSFLAVTGDRT